MSTLKISKHSDVPAALDLVKEEVDKEAERICKAGGAALTAGHVKPATEAIAYAKRLREFVRKIQKLGEEWTKLEARIDAAAPEVKEIVRLPTKLVKPHAGFTLKPGLKKVPKKTFVVCFSDGTTITDAKAKNVLAKAVEHIGAARIAKLGVLVDGEPFVTRDKTQYKKPNSAFSPIAGGWYVATHSSTKSKMNYVTKVAKALGIKVTVTAG